MSIDAPAGSTVNAGHLIARRLKASGIDTIFTLSGGLLFLISRRPPGAGPRADPPPPRADGGLRRRRLVEGDPGAPRRRADRGTRSDQRDECHGRSAAESVAAAGARWAGSGAAVGHGVAAGDRPRAVRGAAGAIRGNGPVGRRRRWPG